MSSRDELLFGRGKYSEDIELDFRKPLQPLSRFSKPWNGHECLRKAAFVMGVILIVSSITALLVTMFDMTDFQWEETVQSDTNNSSLPLHPINATQFTLSPPQIEDIQIMHLTDLEHGTLWSVDFTPASTELSATIFDANGDGKPDLLVTQVTDRQEKLEYCNPDRCNEDYGHTPCQVQLAALSGEDGSIVWYTWTQFAPFAANCRHDLNNDGHFDCILAGRLGTLVAIDTATTNEDGIIIWTVDPHATFIKYNYYYPLMTRDFDRDGVIDLLVTHGGDTDYPPSAKHRTPGTLVVISGRTGQQLSDRILMPDDKETYSSPVLWSVSNNTQLVLFGSGGETISGSLWAITVDSLQSHVDNWVLEHVTEEYNICTTYTNARCVSSNEYGPQRPRNSPETYKVVKNKEEWLAKCPVWKSDTQPLWNPYKVCVYELVAAGKTGTITPPVIIDYNGDGIKDLLVSQFNDHIMMMDGATNTIQWDHHAEDTQSYSIPSPIHFNDDDIPDFLVRFNKGKWMNYDYSYMGVIDGSNGELLWSLNCSLGTMSSAITVKSSKKGHDGMLFMASGCEQQEKTSCSKKETDKQSECSHEQSRPNKRHEGSINSGGQVGVTAEELSNLWEVVCDEDLFPDPWTDTKTFIESYCQLDYDQLTTSVYYLTPGMILSGIAIQPIYTNEPYVYKFPFELFAETTNISTTTDCPSDRRKAIRCSQILSPTLSVSTPIISDFNQDNRLDAIITVTHDSQSNELNVFNSQKVNYKAFDLEERLVQVYGADISTVVDFTLYNSAYEQPWTEYMGSQGDGTYLNTES